MGIMEKKMETTIGFRDGLCQIHNTGGTTMALPAHEEL